MADYEHTETVAADADALFDYLADVRNLPRYFARMTDAEPGDGEEVQVTAEIDVEGKGEEEVQGEAWFKVDRERKAIRWGSEGPNDYSGELEVSRGDGGANHSEVAVRLTTEHDAPDAIQRDLETTTANIKRLVEGR